MSKLRLFGLRLRCNNGPILLSGTARPALTGLLGLAVRISAAASVLMVLLLPVQGVAAAAPSVPSALAPWVPWVLADQDRRACSLASDATQVCAWPGRLALDLRDNGGRFTQHWVLAVEDWLPLPGDAASWPLEVSADGQAVVVVEHGGRPSVRLPAGEHTLSGRFVWPRRPDGLALPLETGMVELRLNGAVVARPRLDASGRLWLGTGVVRERLLDDPDRLSLEVIRRIDDAIPLRVTTRLMLDVSGRTREVSLGPVMLPGGIPLRIESRLPARLDDAGLLQVQLRPGRWELTLEAHHPGPVSALRLAGHPVPWPEQEVWAFAARPDLRQVEVMGAEAVDPRQTRLPRDWQRLPAYLMRSGSTLTLEQLRRGSANADRLGLKRDLWLDFAADGFSLRDHITGSLEQSWRLDVDPALTLGQVRVGGEPRFITALALDDGPARVGVELRQGRLDLLADARFDRALRGLTVRLPASGWALQFDTIYTRLHLPPGWDLLAVQGVDNLPDSWLGRWSLLDLFLVLIIAFAIGRLWGWHWGAVAFLTLALIWQEPGAPRLVWLHVLVAAALLRALPADPARRALVRLRSLVSLYYRAALLALAIIALPFLVAEMRDGLFPQLDKRGSLARHGLGAGLALRDEPRATTPQAGASAASSVGRAGEAARYKSMPSRLEPDSVFGANRTSIAKPLPTMDPGALVQTGAGVPDWQWRSFELSWTGPVAPDHQVRLWLLPPVVALLVAVARVALVLLLGLRLAGWPRSSAPPSPRHQSPPHQSQVAMAVPAWLLAVALITPPSLGYAQAETQSPSAAQVRTQPEAAATAVRGNPKPGLDATWDATGHATGFPPAALLAELKRRLLEPPDCLPRCAEIAHLVLDASATELRLLLAVDAAEAVALPVPGAVDGWRALRLELDGAPLDSMRRDAEGRLLAPVPAGRHRLMLSGPLPRVAQVELPLPLRPRLVIANIAPPWQLDGVDEAGQAADQLRLLRQASTIGDGSGSVSASAFAETPSGDSGQPQMQFPPLLRVTRLLRLGLDWTVVTRVERLSPSGSPVTLRVPLIAGEAVISADRQVADDGVLVSLPPGRGKTGWRSTLQPTDRLRLVANDDPRLTERWQVEVSPLWHLSSSGVPPVHNLSAADRWLPSWRPWPGEELELDLSRPAGVPGPTLTLDRSEYALSPGRRASEATLSLMLRSSQGGRHRIQLPDGAELIRFVIDGQSRPLALQGKALDLPLIPGSQRIELRWREPSGLATLYRPATLDLGTPGVNAETEVRLGRDRWVLWTHGPGIGPAVQFWGLLLVMTLIAALLAQLRLTPLGFVDWLLLGIGLSQVGVWIAALVALWLFALGLRRRLDEDEPAWRFNLAQVGLVLLTLAALLALLVAVQQGLLGSPEMQIAGNGSSAGNLIWYLDRSGPETLAVSVVSVSIWVYRALMLAWALWLALRLLSWLRWGWEGFAEPTLWRELPSKSSRRGAREKQPGDEDLSLDV